MKKVYDCKNYGEAKEYENIVRNELLGYKTLNQIMHEKFRCNMQMAQCERSASNDGVSSVLGMASLMVALLMPTVLNLISTARESVAMVISKMDIKIENQVQLEEFVKVTSDIDKMFSNYFWGFVGIVFIFVIVYVLFFAISHAKRSSYNEKKITMYCLKFKIIDEYLTAKKVLICPKKFCVKCESVQTHTPVKRFKKIRK